jgi:hypothetical protein
MSVAILIPGHLRSYDQTRNSIFECVVLPLRTRGYLCNIFTSIWDVSGFRETSWLGEPSIDMITDDSTKIEKENFHRNYFTSYYSNDKWKEYSHVSGSETCGDAVSMWYKIWKCFNLMKEYESENNMNHDIIIRLRPDIAFLRGDISNNTKLLTDQLCFLDEGIYMSSWHGKYKEVTHKIMDQFAFGERDSMSVYCSVYPNIQSILSRSDYSFTGEGFLKSQLYHNNIDIIRVNIKYSILRANNVIENVTK